MRRVFGKKKASAPAPSLTDASSGLGGRIDEMDKKINDLETELRGYKDRIKKTNSPAAKKQLQKRALEVLKRKRMYEQQRDQIAGQQFNVDQASFGIESAKANVQTVAAMKQANKELKQVIKQDLDIDAVDDLADDMAELMDDFNEVNEALGRNFATPDDIDEADLALEQTAAMEIDFLGQVQETVNRVLKAYGAKQQHHVLTDLAPDQRESLAVALHLQKTLQDMERKHLCRRCWLPTMTSSSSSFCICQQCPPVQFPQKHNNDNNNNRKNTLNRLFLILHHQEIGRSVDTAKLILAALPRHCRLIVPGMAAEFQASLAELQASLKERQRPCLVLFPDDTAQTFDEIQHQYNHRHDVRNGNGGSWDVVVIDGTWQQARRIKKRYFPPLPTTNVVMAKLSDNAVALLDQEVVVVPPDLQGETTATTERDKRNPGHQLRKHSITSRKVGTFEATRLFLADILRGEECPQQPNADHVHATATTIQPQGHASHGGKEKEVSPPWVQMEHYQTIANQSFQDYKQSTAFHTTADHTNSADTLIG
eukprot:CAMPEP_0168757000 /NCGR_PEP_ID=MMETSP0724-20121128/20927_1 /TAXON_ID=265536 /ORGANISM="Amphiprora sp., Strain CCMP467" /LENGTH=538 /DNA_ID=CAMNT_0008805769 /DNA_START=81 /DNA_END=1693 /DNA_ORIENTATION=+